MYCHELSSRKKKGGGEGGKAPRRMGFPKGLEKEVWKKKGKMDYAKNHGPLVGINATAIRTPQTQAT